MRDTGKEIDRKKNANDGDKENNKNSTEGCSDERVAESQKKSGSSNSKKPGARSKGTRECLLVIRGTASSMDWSINMDDLSVPLDYRAGPVGIPTEVLCCAVLCCAVLCCAVLCCTVLYCTKLLSKLHFGLCLLGGMESKQCEEIRRTFCDQCLAFE